VYTTSRYASGDTRTFARRLAEKKGEPYVARGKRTMAELAAFARRTGEETITVVEEKAGGPAVLCTAKVDALGRWSWAGERKVGLCTPDA